MHGWYHASDECAMIVFASLQLRKTDMLRKGQEGHVRAERDILKSASLVNSPGTAQWIVRLFYSFQDRDHLYLVSSNVMSGNKFEPHAITDFTDFISISFPIGTRVHGRRRPFKSPYRARCLRGRFHALLRRRGQILLFRLLSRLILSLRMF